MRNRVPDHLFRSAEEVFERDIGVVGGPGALEADHLAARCISRPEAIGIGKIRSRSQVVVNKVGLLGGHRHGPQFSIDSLRKTGQAIDDRRDRFRKVIAADAVNLGSEVVIQSDRDADPGGEVFHLAVHGSETLGQFVVDDLRPGAVRFGPIHTFLQDCELCIDC